jgi:hypothetical protein
LVSHLTEELRLKLFEFRVLKRIFESNRKEVINKMLYDFHSSPNIINVIKSRRMNKTVHHVADMRDIRNSNTIFVDNIEGNCFVSMVKLKMKLSKC